MTSKKRQTRIYIGGGEGFSIYTDESDDQYLLIFDESMIISLLANEDAEGLPNEKILRFSSAEERSRYLATITYVPAQDQ